MSLSENLVKEIAHREAASRELRRIIELVVSAKLEPSEWEKVNAQLKQVANLIDELKTDEKSVRFVWDPQGNGSGPQFLTSPATGKLNPVSPPALIESKNGAITGIVVFSAQHEGPPTCAHGGYIALVLDEILGAANYTAGYSAMTGKLEISYLKPTPLYKEIQLRAICNGLKGKRLTTTGEMIYNGSVTAKAVGTFITVDTEKFLQIARSHIGENALEHLKTQFET